MVVQEKFSPGRTVFIADKFADSHCLRQAADTYGAGILPVILRRLKLQQRAVEPGRLRLPESVVPDIHDKSIFVLPHAYVRHRMHIIRNGLPGKVPGQNPQAQPVIPLQGIRVISDTHPHLGHMGVNVRTDKDVFQIQAGSVLQRYLPCDAGSRGAVMPSHLRIIPARARGSVELVTVQ